MVNSERKLKFNNLKQLKIDNIMKTIIEDDVLFHNKSNDDFEFIVDDEDVLEVRKDNKIIGKLHIHFDEDVAENLKEEGFNTDFESCNYVYINNEVVYLDNLLNLRF